MKQSAGQEYGKAAVHSFDFSYLKSLLQKRKDELQEQAIFGNVRNNKDIEDIDRVLQLIENNKIKINGKFRVERSATAVGGVSQKIHWQSVYSIGKSIEATAGKQGWATAILQETIIKNIAEKQGLLISNTEKARWGKKFDDGSESDVYNDPDNLAVKVIKVVKYLGQSNSLSNFFERTIGFNKLFPKTAYDIVGFIEDKVLKIAFGRDTMLKPVLKQPYVYGTIIARLDNPQKEFINFLSQFQRLGYIVNFAEETITKDGYEASDLNWGNVIKMPDGQYYVIDAWVRKIGQT